MSSGNLIQHSYLEEATFAEVNPVGDFQAISKTSAAFTATPEISSSTTVRSDRKPSGQTVTGLDVNASISNEFSRTVIHDDFIEATMMDTWPAFAAAIVQDMAYDGTADTLTTTGGTDLTTVVNVGDTVQISGLVAPADVYNGIVFYVTSVTATVLGVITSDTVADWDATAGAGASTQVSPYINIGSTLRSFSFEKQYLDMTNKAIMYTGEVFSSFNATFEYGSIPTIEYSLMGSDKDILNGTPIVQPGGARTLLAIPSEKFFSAVTGIPYIIIDGVAVLYCIESLSIGNDNGLTSRSCVGKRAKTAFDLGTANVTVSTTAHFSDANFGLLQKILDQTIVQVIFPVINEDGFGYNLMVYCQLSGDDPDSTGQDAQAMLDLSGTGIPDATTGEVIRISKIGELP